jgi:hypothetical protein
MVRKKKTPARFPFQGEMPAFAKKEVFFAAMD